MFLCSANSDLFRMAMLAPKYLCAYWVQCNIMLPTVWQCSYHFYKKQHCPLEWQRQNVLEWWSEKAIQGSGDGKIDDHKCKWEWWFCLWLFLTERQQSLLPYSTTWVSFFILYFYKLCAYTDTVIIVCIKK